MNLHLSSRLATVLLSLTAATAALADYSSTVTSFNPLGYWRFNEPAASPPLNIMSNITALGSALNGYVISTTVTQGEAGIIGKSYHFVNGPPPAIGSDFSKADVPWAAAINPQPPFSVEFWAKPNSLPTSDTTGVCPVSNFDPNFSGASRSGWLFYVSNLGTWRFWLGNRSGYAFRINATSGNAVAGTWQHIVATWDGATANLYANGVLIGTGAASAANVVINPQSFLRVSGTSLTGTGAVAPAISVTSNNGNRGFDGWLEELAIYTNLLSASKIAAHYAAATTNNAGYNIQVLGDGPVAFWPMNEPAVTAPNPSTLPIAVNSGTLGSAANGTNEWGALTGQTGTGYPGFGAGDHACLFDGVNGYCQINDAPGLHFTGQITMMAWVKPTEQDYFRTILGHGFDVNGAETFLRISRGPGSDGTGDGNYYEVGTSDGTTYYDSVLVPIPSADIGNWVFLAGTFDGTSWNLYRNGVLAGSFNTLSSGDEGAVDVTMPWCIGSRSPDGNFVGQGQFFSGGIDEPAIFSTALTPSQISTIYNAADVPPVIITGVQPPPNPYKNNSCAFNVWAVGSPPLTYLWYSNGVPTGVTTTNLTLNNLTVGPLTVAVSVVNAFGSNYSATTFTVINSPPLIQQQPKSIALYTGFPFSLSIVAAGTAPISYHWRTNADIPGATSPIYSTIMSPATAGSYTCALTNEAGSSNSAVATVTSLPIPGGYQSAVITNNPGPIAYWRLSEPSGTVAYDYIGGNNGTYFNATLGEPGFSTVNPDTSAAFSGLNSYVGNISGTAINFSGHTNFSIEVWVNAPPNQSDESTIIAKGIGQSGTVRNEQFSIDVAGGLYRFFTTGNNNAMYEADATSAGPNGTWQHIVAVYDDLNTLGNGSQMYLYVNGELQGSAGTRPAGLNTTASPVSIGSKRTGNDPNYDGTFNGNISQVSIYSYAMTAATVLAHYGAAYGSGLAPFINVQPQPTTNYVTLGANIKVSAAGSVPLTYQWKLNGVNLTDGPTGSGSTIAGSSTESLTVTNLTSSDAGTYSVGITNPVKGLLSSGAKLTVLPAPTAPVTIPGLVLHLPFDNNLNDLTGRGNNGTAIHSHTNLPGGGGYLSNVVAGTYVTDGRLGQAFHYNTVATTNGVPAGSSSATDSDWATLGVRPDLQFSSNVSFTVSLWIRLPLNYQGGDLPFFGTAAGSANNPGFVMEPTYGTLGTASPASTGVDGGWASSLYDVSGNGNWLYSSVLGSINDGLWHHLVYVFNRVSGSTGEKVYLDGAPAGSKKQGGNTSNISALGNVDTGLAAAIGQDPTGLYGETGSGDIDDLGVWRRALSPVEAAGIFMAAQGGFSFVAGNSPLPPITIIQTTPGNLQLTWPYGTLQSATNVLGPYSDVPGAGAPPYNTANSPVRRFFRTRL
jgi:hypothetical protein